MIVAAYIYIASVYKSITAALIMDARLTVGRSQRPGPVSRVRRLVGTFSCRHDE